MYLARDVSDEPSGERLESDYRRDAGLANVVSVPLERGRRTHHDDLCAPTRISIQTKVRPKSLLLTRSITGPLGAVSTRSRFVVEPMEWIQEAGVLDASDGELSSIVHGQWAERFNQRMRAINTIT
jgi:hypothetical protein